MSLFGGFGGGLGSNTGEKKTGTLFGSTTAPAGGLFNQPAQQQQQQQPAQQQGGLFGGAAGQQQQQQPQSSMFASTQQQNAGSSLFSQQQPQQQPQQQQQPAPNNSLFGALLQPAPALNQIQAQSLHQSQALPQLRQSVNSPFAISAVSGQREKSIMEQMRILNAKWNSMDPECAFQYYFYNHVNPDEAPFYGPQPFEDERKWEEALSKKPSPGSIPVLARGFEEVAARINQQTLAVTALRTRLHEINNSLSLMKDAHELNVASRITEAKRKHIVHTQRTLALATKVQIMRNRGYVMDQAEEELKKKLIELEKKTFDPVLGGRQEEIWARMSGVRERARILQEETEKVGRAVDNQQNGEILSEDDQKALEKLLKDYDRQLEHLKKWIDDTKQEYDEWEKEKPGKPAAR
ncbi:hypothetical protein BS50DRAFT_573331 [Corynespora cassiicola Philippines]|uniref:Nucleoporin Nup54 alpha-helical domain-containing protein n=1 Tax=Corynespora cassiicola Philippines TaxID=1448308 RepID=A0A2T2NT24_CORCC|nr:hypothetical protein BS50DRAFT_573331 [Corynespora cassiicola Philippines]